MLNVSLQCILPNDKAVGHWDKGELIVDFTFVLILYHHSIRTRRMRRRTLWRRMVRRKLWKGESEEEEEVEREAEGIEFGRVEGDRR